MRGNDIWSGNYLLDRSLEQAAWSAELARSLGSGLAHMTQAPAATAAQRIERIRSSGLLALTVDRSLGGLGGGVVELLQAVRQLAQADSTLAQCFGLHQLQLLGLQLHDGQAAAVHGARQLRETAEQQLFWAGASPAAAGQVRARRVGDGWRLDGISASFAGALDADRLTITATTPEGDSLVGIVPARRQGVLVQRDAGNAAQGATESVRLDDVFLSAEELLQQPGVARTPRSRLQSQVGDLITANLYLGIAEGAFEEARRHTLAQSRPWGTHGQLRAADEPTVQQRFADLWLYVRSAQAMADATGIRLQAALDRGQALTAQERGDVAVAGVEARVLAQRAGIEVSTQLFELAGAQRGQASPGPDRFLRDVRARVSRDPLDSQLLDLGRYSLDRCIPDPASHA